MMDTATVNRQEVRRRPLVWVKELVLYKSIDPVVDIRRMSFSMGLNIIQGTMSESTDHFESGHGIGKTTVCRLIRYCLGEKSFGQAHVLEEVKHCFPNSYIGAMIEVDGSEWAVLRPLGTRRKQFAHQGGTLSELIETDEAQKYEDFTAALETAALAGVPDRAVLTNGRSIQWLHILAMCSRDQESRYDLWWNWRHSRSESTPAKFDKPKVDAGICIRSVLGLFDPEERKLRARLEKLETDLPAIREKIKAKDDEPRFHVNRLRTTLETDYGVTATDDASLEQNQLFGLTQAANNKEKSLRAELAEIDKEIPTLDLQINYTSARLLELSETFGQIDAASEATLDSTAVATNDLDRLRQRRTELTHGIERPCPYGLVTIKDCSYFQTHLSTLDDELAQSTQETATETSENDQISAALSEQAQLLEKPIKALEARRSQLNEQKNALLERRLALNELLRRLPIISDQLKTWNRIITGAEPHEEMDSLRGDEKTTVSEIEKAEKRLGEVISQQSKRAESFSGRFNQIVQQVINNEFRGVVDIHEEGVSFRINRGNSLFGEAYETLAVLLADLAILAESSSVEIHHPGFLVHDSPREADLNIRIYERMLEMTALMMEKAGADGDLPFQYIVTTTTPPPESLPEDQVTKHYLSSGAGSLFGMQLETVSPKVAQRQLFELDGDDE